MATAAATTSIPSSNNSNSNKQQLDDGFDGLGPEHSAVLNSSNNNPDSVAADFATYEDYLDAQITPLDLYYLEDKDLARQLVELGYRGQGEPVKRSDFDIRKRGQVSKIIQAQQQQSLAAATTSSSSSKDQQRIANTKISPELTDTVPRAPVDTPFIQALRDREEALRQGKLSSILFLCVRRSTSSFSTSGGGQNGVSASSSHEISGYIDLGDRLSQESFDKYYNHQQFMLPRIGDLSYYNWDTGKCQVNESGVFQVISENRNGLVFRNKRDRKLVFVDPKLEPTEDTKRTVVKSSEYQQIVFYDHVIRRKM